MIHYQNFNLKQFNTFRIEYIAKDFFMIENAEEIPLFIKSDSYLSKESFILGEGSNLLFVGNTEKNIIKIGISKILVKDQSSEFVIIEAGAGTKWQNLVEFSLKNKAYGLENLALIPGSVGAAPVQNIGAYGSEQADYLFRVRGYNIKNDKFEEYSREDCSFSYRKSIFKEELKDNFIITNVSYRLSKESKLNYKYKDLQAELNNLGIIHPTHADVFNAVCAVRRRKLPDIEVLGNAGSFFKNPTVNDLKLEEMKRKNADVVCFQTDNQTSFKLSAGWLIEKCGWKGKRIGDAGVSEKHALILVNYGNAKGKDIDNLALLIEESVYTEFGVKLEREVIII